MKQAKEIMMIKEELCIGCGLCAADCIREAIALNNGKAFLRPVECNSCGHCYAICPRDAVAYADSREVPQPAGAMPSAGDMEWLMKSRRSMRHFLSESIPREDLEKIMEIGRYCPTARNSQDVSFKVLTGTLRELESLLDEKLLAAQEASGQPPQGERIRDGYIFRKAPAAILIFSPTPVNGALAAAYMELYAQTLGYGVLYVGRLITALRQFPQLRELAGLCEGEEPVVCIALGRPGMHYGRIPRRDPLKAAYIGKAAADPSSES